MLQISWQNSFREDKGGRFYQNMTRKNLFMAVQAILCMVIATLLSGGALSLYLPRKRLSRLAKASVFLPGRAKLTD